MYVSTCILNNVGTYTYVNQCTYVIASGRGIACVVSFMSSTQQHKNSHTHIHRYSHRRAIHAYTYIRMSVCMYATYACMHVNVHVYANE